MRKLTYYVASTLDGFIAAPDGGVDFFIAEGDHMAALTSERPETVPGHWREAVGITEDNKQFDTVLEGRRTYEVGLLEGITNAFPHLRHYVFSNSISESPDPTVEIVSSDPVAKVRELKQDDGLGIWLCGGGTLAATLRSEIDELVIKLNPVVIGDGIPLFAGEFRPRAFELTRSQVYKSGVTVLTYRAQR